MKQEHKVALKKAGTFGLIGAGVLAVVGNPAAWALLGLTTYRIGKSAYEQEKLRGMLRKSNPDHELFI